MKMNFAGACFLIVALAALASPQESPTLTARFAVLDEAGNFFRDLQRADVRVAGYKDWTLALAADRPLELIVLIDASVSQEKTLPAVKQAATAFVKEHLVAGRDRAGVISFADKPLLAQEVTDDLGKAADGVARVRIVFPQGYVGGGVTVGRPPAGKAAAGSTSAWDSLVEALEILARRPAAGAQRAVVLVSDGVNTGGRTRLEDVIAFSAKTKIPVCAIGIGDANYAGVDRKTLKKLADGTGGLAVFPGRKPDELAPQLRRLEQSLRASYDLTLTPAAPLNDEKTRLKIEIVNPELRRRNLEIVSVGAPAAKR